MGMEMMDWIQETNTTYRSVVLEVSLAGVKKKKFAAQVSSWAIMWIVMSLTMIENIGRETRLME